MKKIEVYFEEFGLSPVESKLYLALLEKGPSTILELSKATQVNRTTTHINIESLIKKGLATHIKMGAKRHIIAEPPEKFSTLLAQEKVSIKRKEDSLPDMMKLISNSIANVKENTSSEVRYYEGRDNISNLYDEILKSKEIKSYVNTGKILNIFPENNVKFIKAIKKGAIIWDLQGDGEYIQSMNEAMVYPNYHVKLFPNGITINSMDYLIHDDSIAIVYGEDSPTAIVIKNKLLAENARILYDLLWGLLP